VFRHISSSQELGARNSPQAGDSRGYLRRGPHLIRKPDNINRIDQKTQNAWKTRVFRDTFSTRKRISMNNMWLDENNCEETIRNFTRQDWQPLIELIPQIESTSKFGELVGGEKNDDGIIQFPYWIPSLIVNQ